MGSISSTGWALFLLGLMGRHQSELPADELSLWMAALRTYAMLHELHWYATAGLSPSQADFLLQALGKALDRRCLTRQELAGEVAQRVGT